jgi:hypothetical protein
MLLIKNSAILSGRRLQQILVTICLLLLFFHTHSSIFSQTAKNQDADNLTVAKVLSNVRKAVNYDELKKLKRGFVLEEFQTKPDESSGRILTFGSSGEFREDLIPRGDRPFGFDGKYAWQPDRTGFPTPVAQRLREKLLIPAWVRSGWWLDKNSPVNYSILPEETNEKQVALSMKLERGLVEAKIFIDRQNWLPKTLAVEYERGLYTLTFSDYQETLGIRFPQRTFVNYRGSDSEFKVKSITEIPRNADNPFKSPAPPDDTIFDNNLPAELKVAQGVPFSELSPGHFYVRPTVDSVDLGWFHFDSGSDAMHIDTKFADELKMPILGKSQSRGADGKVQEVTIRQGKTFQLGRIIYKNPIFLAMDLSERNAPPGEKRAGLVGYPLFARAVLEVAEGGKHIRLYDPKNYKLSTGKWQELSYIDLTPAVVCRFEGNRTGLFQLDTGYTGTVTFYDKFIAEQKLLEGRQIKDETGIGAGGTYKLVAGKIDWFELAGYRFKNPRAGFRVSGFSREGGAGVVGREFLSVFTVVFNYPERNVAFLR